MSTRTLFRSVFLPALLLTLLLAGCKKDKPPGCNDPQNPACANFDICNWHPATDAGFVTGRKSHLGGLLNLLPFRDTIPIGSIIRVDFMATNAGMDSYEWRVGSDPRVFTNPSFFLTFEGVSGWVDIHLTAYNDRANPNCHPEDTGRVTVTKSHYFKPYVANTHEEFLVQYPVFGNYLGHPEGSQEDTSRVTIGWGERVTDTPYIEGMPNQNCGRLLVSGFFLSYNTHYFSVTQQYPLPAVYDDPLCAAPKRILATLMPDNSTLHVDSEILIGGRWFKQRWVGVKQR